MQNETDPRTELEIVDVPPEHGKYFAELKGAVIHWFGRVDKYNRVWRPQPRIAILSDQCVYLCRTDGGITRCLNVRHIQELVLSEQTAIGFRVGAPDYDMLIAVKSMQDREAIVHVLTRVYWAQCGRELRIRRLTGDTGEAMQQRLQLTKPDNWTLKVEPITSKRVLSKIVRDREAKFQRDHQVVEAEFRRVKEGLKHELQTYRSEEYDRLVQQLAEFTRSLEAADSEIQHLRATSVSMDNKEVWRNCPNCAELRALIDSTPSDDRQRILRLERQVASQRHIVEHLQVAIQFRSTHTGGATSATGEVKAVQADEALRQELAAAQHRNKELQQLIFESPHLSADVKTRAARIAQHRDGAMGITTAATAADLQDVLTRQGHEIRHLKATLAEVTQSQLAEIERLRLQLQIYDGSMVEYLERVFVESMPNLVGSARRLLQDAAMISAARA